MTRSDRVPLDPREPRCTAVVCAAQSKCARAKAAIPHQWAKLQDYSAPELGGIGTAGTALCVGFVSVAGLLAQPKQSARRVHPPMGSFEHSDAEKP